MIATLPKFTPEAIVAASKAAQKTAITAMEIRKDMPGENLHQSGEKLADMIDQTAVSLNFALKHKPDTDPAAYIVGQMQRLANEPIRNDDGLLTPAKLAILRSIREGDAVAALSQLAENLGIQEQVMEAYGKMKVSASRRTGKPSMAGV